MEVIGRICSNSFTQIHQDLQDCVEKFEIIYDAKSVGISTKNNILLEFDNDTGRLFRGYKLQKICTDFKVIHDFDGRYQIVLIYQSGFEVIKPRIDENRYESVYYSDKSILGLEIIDDSKGHEVIQVQNSPSSYETLDFIEKRTNFQVIFSKLSIKLVY